MLDSVRFEVWVAVVVVVVVYIVDKVVRKYRTKYPPGPCGLPVVGYIPFLNKNVHLQFTDLAKKYGEVFSLHLGSESVVVLNGTASIREAFTKAEFLGRPPHSAFSLLGTQSPFFLDDLNVWQEQRKFVVHSMKDLGLGKSKIEESIQDEIRHFQEAIEEHHGEPIELLTSLTPSISNNICSLIFGKRYDYDDPERVLLDETLNEVANVIAQTASHIFFSWIRHFPFLLKWLGYDKGVLAYKKMDDFFMLKVKQHRETLDPKNLRDFVDSYLVEMENRNSKDTNSSFTDPVLLGNLVDMFGAGTEPVRTTLSWCLYTMAAYPDVQKRVQQEIKEVVGAERSPEFQDQKSMSYTHAVMLEVMRWKTTLPLNLLRYTTNDTTLGEYTIPRGTTIMANFWAVHHDSGNWSQPDTFKPERFLSTDGKSVVKSANFMPFSVGKRACPGETMANMEIFLYFVSILQKFDLRLPDGIQPTFDAELTITYRLKPYKIQFVPRN